MTPMDLILALLIVALIVAAYLAGKSHGRRR
jgi:hypothetical protein